METSGRNVQTENAIPIGGGLKDKELVLQIYPNATCRFCNNIPFYKWRVYYSWKTVKGTTTHQLLGQGESRNKAWRMAWKAIQLSMLSKFEGNK